MILIKDLIAAEGAFLAAEREERSFATDPNQWSAYGSVDRAGRKSRSFTAAQFEREDFYRAKVAEQRAALVALRQAFMEGR